MYIFVEGGSDEAFFKSVIVPRFEQKGIEARLIQYAWRTKEYRRKMICALNRMGEDYIYVADLGASNCVTERKRLIISRYTDLLEERIIVVVREIEGWYLAGLSVRVSAKLRIRNYRETNSLTKNVFERAILVRFTSLSDAKIEILNNYSVSSAASKNESIRYFLAKHSLI